MNIKEKLTLLEQMQKEGKKEVTIFCNFFYSRVPFISRTPIGEVVIPIEKCKTILILGYDRVEIKVNEAKEEKEVSLEVEKSEETINTSLIEESIGVPSVEELKTIEEPSPKVEEVVEEPSPKVEEAEKPKEETLPSEKKEAQPHSGNLLRRRK